MTTDTLFTMICYMIVCSFTPGPGNILSLNTMTKYDWKDGKRVIAGVCCGYLVVQYICTFAVFGLNEVLAPALHILKYVGGVYMMWLAYHIVVSKPQTELDEKKPTFRSGFFLQLVNVKIYFYITSLLSVYYVPYIKKLSLLLAAGVGAVAIGSMASFTWAFLGLKIQKVYNKYYRPINIVLGLFLVYCAWNIVRS